MLFYNWHQTFQFHLTQELIGVDGGDSIVKVDETFQETIGQKCVLALLKLPGASRSPGGRVVDKF